MTGIAKPARAFWTRVPAAYTTRGAKDIGDQFEAAGIKFLKTALVERDAFKGMFGLGATLDKLKPDQVPTLEKARDNASAFTREVVHVLKEVME
jgi:chromosome partitioning protein